MSTPRKICIRVRSDDNRCGLPYLLQEYVCAHCALSVMLRGISYHRVGFGGKLLVYLHKQLPPYESNLNLAY